MKVVVLLKKECKEYSLISRIYIAITSKTKQQQNHSYIRRDETYLSFYKQYFFVGIMAKNMASHNGECNNLL